MIKAIQLLSIMTPPATLPPMIKFRSVVDVSLALDVVPVVVPVVGTFDVLSAPVVLFDADF